ncbi:MAG: hypothetical protein HY515_02375 [Candidatus Aenigmarchaeota archaeon]|nr:hypothetical protein [Candidatus Aenigmarchaeota archaeon]
MMFSVLFQGTSNSVASSIFKVLEKYQAQELIVPFLLTFVIAYGVLDTINIFKKNSINAIVSLAISFFAISYGPYGSMGKFLTQLYGTGAVALAGLVILMIILGALSLGGERRPGVGIFGRLFGVSGGAIGGIIVVVVMIFLLASGWFQNVGIRLDPDTTVLLIVLLLIVALIAVVTHPSRARSWMHGWFPPHPDDERW